METSQTLAVGVVLRGGQYRIIGVLGQGGFGITYLAEDTALGIKVAVKEFFVKDFCHREVGCTMRVTSTSQETRDLVERLRAKFFKEARNIAGLNHPNIVRVLAAFEENGTAYYVMDYIEGESLGSLVKRTGALPPEQALRYIRAIGEALEYVHSKGINHLDVKPANIMVRASDDTALLIDFGVSKQYDKGGNQTSSTPVGLSHGFAPLEQYKEGGVKEFSPQTDVYALAATLYCLLSGHTPAPATDLVDAELPRIPGIQSAMMDAINKAMSPFKRHRQQSMRQFLNELDGLDATLIKPLGVGSSSSTKAEHAPSTKQTHKRRKYGLLISIVSVICCLVIILFIFKGGHEADTSSVHSALASTIPSEEHEDALDSEVWYDSNADEIRCGIKSYKMVFVSGGSFMMGNERRNLGTGNEKPVHRVTLDSYCIGRSEVPQWLWIAVMNNNPSHFQGENLPVEKVRYADCEDFIRRLNGLTGKQFRLPTEAEWEYAARGGSKCRGYKYSGSNNQDDVAWYYRNSKSHTHEVDSLIANELGLHDMSGNVQEWCSDWYGNYTNESQINPAGPASGRERVCRGGLWSGSENCCRISYRAGNLPNSERKNLGFRLAM